MKVNIKFEICRYSTEKEKFANDVVIQAADLNELQIFFQHEVVKVYKQAFMLEQQLEGSICAFSIEQITLKYSRSNTVAEVEQICNYINNYILPEFAQAENQQVQVKNAF